MKRPVRECLRDDCYQRTRDGLSRVSERAPQAGGPRAGAETFPSAEQCCRAFPAAPAVRAPNPQIAEQFPWVEQEKCRRNRPFELEGGRLSVSDATSVAEYFRALTESGT